MQKALDLPKALTPEILRTLRVVLTTVVVVLVVTGLLVAISIVAQNLAGGAPLTPATPEPGLDL